MDSDIFIQELAIEDNRIRMLGNIFIDRVTDNLGTFVLPDNLTSPYLEIRVNGYYFNEVSGEPSDGTISLGSYSSIKDGIAPNINILTTLAQKRIKHLIQEEGLSFEEAETQAKTEVLRSFHINEELSNFDELRIDGNSQGDAALLAISIVLQGDFSTVELSNFIARIREDLRENGRIDDEGIYEIICSHTQQINPIDIRNTLTEYYESLNIEDYQVPIFEDYLDSDCNGAVNKDDPESFIFFKKYYNPSGLRIYFDRFSIGAYQDSLWVFNSSGIYKTNSLDSIWERVYFSDNLGISYPLIVNHINKLYFIGGRATFRDRELGSISLDTMSIYQINQDEIIEKIRNRGYGDYIDEDFQGWSDDYLEPDWDFINAHILCGDRNLRIYPNYSNIDHNISVVNDKIYVFNKYNYYLWFDNSMRFDECFGFYGAQVSSDGLNWHQDFLSEFLADREHKYDLEEFNGSIYLLETNADHPNLKKLTEILDQQEIIGYEIDHSHEELVSQFEFASVRSQLSMLRYKSSLLISFGSNANNFIFYSSADGSNWNSMDITSKHFDGNILYNPIEFKDFLHIFTDDSEVISFGHYQYYKSYLGLEGSQGE
jgi:hypothetical protein